MSARRAGLTVWVHSLVRVRARVAARSPGRHRPGRASVLAVRHPSLAPRRARIDLDEFLRPRDGPREPLASVGGDRMTADSGAERAEAVGTWIRGVSCG